MTMASKTHAQRSRTIGPSRPGSREELRRGASGPSTQTDAVASSRNQDRIARIRQLNDRLRCHARGGIIQMTNGIAALGLARIDTVMQKIAEFDQFTKDNDPWGEHDCAVMEIGAITIIWKMDYYDRSRTYHSPDPADPKVTVRVLTIMLAEEY